MAEFLLDLRFAIRQLRKSSGFAFTAIFTLALGIGATTSIFSIVNAALLRPLPFPDQDRLVWINDTRVTPQSQKAENGFVLNVLSYPDFFDLREQNHSLAYMSAYHDSTYTLTGRGDAVHLDGFIVSAEFFRALGIHPEFGRDFLPEDERVGAHVAMLSHQTWQTIFGSDKSIVGKSIMIGDLGYVVAGVMPAGFNFPVQTPAPQIWTTMADDAVDSGGHPVTAQRGAHFLDVVGRLRPGCSVEQAQADLTLITKSLARQYPKTNKDRTGVRVETQLEHLTGNTRPALRLLFTAVLFLHFIGCANVAGLLLARGSRRRSEIAVRTALGAGRMQIIRQILVESLVLAVLGGFAGILLASATLRAMLRFMPQNLPRLEHVPLDIRVLAFALLLSVATGLLFGVLPALRISRLDPSASLREDSRTATPGRRQNRLQGILVVAETALSLILLVGSGLLIRSLLQALRVDPGLDTHHVLLVNLDLPDDRYPGDKNVQFYDQLVSRLSALPGVNTVSAGWPMPLTGSMMRISFKIEGRSVPESDEPSEIVSTALPGFFRSLRIPIKQGREFTDADTRTSPLVAIINEQFAHKYFPGENPVGKHIQPGLGDGYTKSDRMREIVGVVGDIKRSGFTRPARPEYYLPHSQATVASPTILLRANGDPTNLINSVRADVATLDKNIPVFDVRTYDDLVASSFAARKFQSLLLTSFAALALLLSAIGLYAGLSYMVAQRALEIGVRMALGARRRDVLELILFRGISLAVIGLAVGLAGSFALTRYIGNLLYAVTPLDPATLFVVSFIFLFVALLASVVPAWRAARLDPMMTLRSQ
jgi:predicted permease